MTKTRTPTWGPATLSEFDGVSSLRFAERELAASSLKLPPRFTRLAAPGARPLVASRRQAPGGARASSSVHSLRRSPRVEP